MALDIVLEFADRTWLDLGVQAVVAALEDAGLTWSDVQRAYCGAMAPVGPFAGNRIGHELGLTGVPIVNVDNASASEIGRAHV